MYLRIVYWKNIYRTKVFNAEALIDNIIKVHQPSALFVVPTMLHQLVNKDLYASNIKTIFSSGAKLSKEQFDNVTQRYPYIDLIEFSVLLKQVL